MLNSHQSASRTVGRSKQCSTHAFSSRVCQHAFKTQGHRSSKQRCSAHSDGSQQGRYALTPSGSCKIRDRSSREPFKYMSSVCCAGLEASRREVLVAPLLMSALSLVANTSPAMAEQQTASQVRCSYAAHGLPHAPWRSAEQVEIAANDYIHACWLLQLAELYDEILAYKFQYPVSEAA
jgi:hypothetical protein